MFQSKFRPKILTKENIKINNKICTKIIDDPAIGSNEYEFNRKPIQPKVAFKSINFKGKRKFAIKNYETFPWIGPWTGMHRVCAYLR